MNAEATRSKVALPAATRPDPIPATTSSRATSAPSPSFDEKPEESPSTRTWERCGDLECLRFDSSSEALRHVLTTAQPRVLAVGESHAPKGSEGIPSTAEHVRREWLPVLSGLASDVVMELPIPPRNCETARREVTEKVERPVANRQRGDNKNEFLELANESRAANIQPWALEPSCVELAKVANAGEDSVAAMLTLIADLTLARLELLDSKRPSRATLLAYGGALHNDVAPALDRQSWSFGPALIRKLGARYVELDAFVPEHVRDTDGWRNMPWYRHFDPTAAPGKVTLFRTGPASFTLLFARTETVKADESGR